MENLKPFDLEKALAGAKVVTRDGREVSEIVLLKTLRSGRFPVITVVNGMREEYAMDGTYNEEKSESNYDLFLATEIKTGWIGIFSALEGCSCSYCSSNVYETAEELDRAMQGMQGMQGTYTALQISWSE